jgi:hypothetical protein
MWIVDVPGQRPDGGHPPWTRLRRLAGDVPEHDVLEYLKQLVPIHGSARAVQGGVEISVHRSRWSICRQL